MLEDKIKLCDKLVQERRLICENLNRISEMRWDLNRLESEYGIKIVELRKEIDELKQKESEKQ